MSSDVILFAAILLAIIAIGESIVAYWRGREIDALDGTVAAQAALIDDLLEGARLSNAIAEYTEIDLHLDAVAAEVRGGAG